MSRGGWIGCLAGALALGSLPGLALAEGPCSSAAADALVLKAAEGVGHVVAEPSVPDIKVGQQFALVLTLCGEAAGAAVSAVDATMPKHRHGMNYQPRISQGQAPGTWKAEGLLMHMPGEWRLTVDVQAGDARVRYAADLIVTP